MKIPESLAQKIVDRMKDIIHREINFKDTEGFIVASTDTNRIGNFHPSALKSMKDKKMLIITKAEEDKEKDIREGINVPIFLEEDVVGVIGITGNYQEVRQYGEIIKSMTEILIKEAFTHQQSYLERQNYKLLIEDIIFNVMDRDYESIKDRATFMGIDHQLKRTIIRIEVAENNNVTSSYLSDSYFRINQFLKYNRKHIIFQNGISFLILYNGHYDAEMRDFLFKVSDLFKKRFEISHTIGVGLPVSNLFDIRKSYQTSTIALQTAEKARSDKFYSYFGELDTEILIQDLSSYIKNTYFSKIYNNVSEDKIEDYIKLLNVYIKNNGSINKTASDLFIHKNTVQYRLDKIYQETGYNPRDYSDLIKLSLANSIHLYR